MALPYSNNFAIFRTNAYVETNQGLSIDVSRLWKSMREPYIRWITPNPFDEQDSSARNMHILCSSGVFLFHDKTSSAMYINLIQVIRRRNRVRKEITHDWRLANGILLSVHMYIQQYQWFAPFGSPNLVTRTSGFLENDSETRLSVETFWPMVFKHFLN